MQTKPQTSAPATAAKLPILEARGIVKVLGEPGTENTVLKGVDVKLYPGELTLLMGPSGSGKTTLLSILGCILTATKGELAIAGERADGLGAEALADLRRRHVGFVFQSYNLFPTLTALENVMLALDVRNGAQRGAMERATDALQSVGLGHRLQAYPSKLSGGEKQRVALARALSGRGSIILADEPTAALDSENGRSVMELLAKVAQDPSRAVLAVTHDHRTLAFADRIIHIEDGRIVGEERPREAKAAQAQTAAPSRVRAGTGEQAAAVAAPITASPAVRAEPRLVEQNENHPDQPVADAVAGSKTNLRRRRRA